MATKSSARTQKTIFQVRYKPQLRFYDLLNAIAQRFEGYPHWTTNRLKVTLRDFEARHNITIAHDSTSYESDAPKTPIETQQIAAVIKNLPDYVQDGEVLRIGLRHKYLVPVSMNQSELEAVLNGKLLSMDFLQALDDEPKDMTIVLVGSRGENSYRVTLGPITRAELPRFLEFNAEHHIDPKDREATLAAVYSNLSEVSLYIDFDCFRVAESMKLEDVSSFIKDAPSMTDRFLKKLVDFIFEVDV